MPFTYYCTTMSRRRLVPKTVALLLAVLLVAITQPLLPTTAVAQAPRVALVTQTVPAPAPDQAYVDHLTGQGWDVTVIDDEDVESQGPAAVSGYDLVVVTAMASPNLIRGSLRFIAEPVVVGHHRLFRAFQMASYDTTASGYTTSTRKLAIVDSASPLVDGLPAGEIVVSDFAKPMNFGRVAPAAHVAAVAKDNVDQAVLFSFDQGDELATGRAAPGRRVGIYMGKFAPNNTNAVGWRLFDAAATWAAAQEPPIQEPPTQEPPTQEPPTQEPPCETNGGFANDPGKKVWCWEDLSIPAFQGTTAQAFSEGQLKTAVECDTESVAIDGDQITFRVEPLTPQVPSWCSRNFNMRSEIRTTPWRVDQPLGTEEWFGWTYTFADDYVIDLNNEWLFFQIHPGIVGLSPQVELMVANDRQHPGGLAGQIFVINKGNYPDNSPTGITPTAGTSLDIVVHVVYGDASNGQLQVWIDGAVVYDKQVSTVYADQPWGGNAKWGIYKWPWNDADRVQQSRAQGINRLEMSMGPLRVITRYPADPDYLQDAYDDVAPD